MSHHIHVEHIVAQNNRSGLSGVWDNYLLSCTNCNTTKGDKAFSFDDIAFPDRDNTGHAFAYTLNGHVEPDSQCNSSQQAMAQEMIDLVGLNANPKRRNGRVDQRFRARVRARNERDEYEEGVMPKHKIGQTAADVGFYSIWMDVFEAYPEVRRCIVEAYRGTAPSCYDDDMETVSPRPITPDIAHLDGAGKV